MSKATVNVWNIMEIIFMYIHSTHAYCLYTIRLDRYAYLSIIIPNNYMLCLFINNYTK